MTLELLNEFLLFVFAEILLLQHDHSSQFNVELEDLGEDYSVSMQECLLTKFILWTESIRGNRNHFNEEHIVVISSDQKTLKK